MEETYYIFTHGSLARKDNTLRFISEDGKKRDLPIENISDIYIFSEMNLNISLLNLLSKMGISVHFFNYYQYYIGSFYPKEQKLAGKLLTQQVEHYLNPEKRLFLAKRLSILLPTTSFEISDITMDAAKMYSLTWIRSLNTENTYRNQNPLPN